MTSGVLIFFLKKMLQRFGETKIGCTFASANAKIAQLVEHDLAKVGVAGSSPVFRSKPRKCSHSGYLLNGRLNTQVVELVDTLL